VSRKWASSWASWRMGRRVPLLVWIRLYIRQLLNVRVGLREEVGR